MEIDLNAKLGAILKWDLTLSHDGRSFAVKPISIADLGALMKGLQGSLSELAAILPQCFVGDAAIIAQWVGGMRAEMLMAAATLILEYLKEITRKNCKALAATLPSLVRAVPSSESSSSIPS